MENSSEQLNVGVDGEVAYCQECTSPIVLYQTNGGYKLVCSCPDTAVDAHSVTSYSNLFDPMSGKWSQIDDVNAKTDYDG